MAPVRLIARKRLSGPYAGRTYLPGEEFEARSESDARYFVSTLQASRVEVPPVAEPAPAPEPEPESAPAVADEPAPLTPMPDETDPETPDVPSDEPKPKRRYRRRDLQAEDS